MKVVETGKCFICGNKTEFMIDDASCLYREAICSHCGASKRNSDVAHSIVQTFIGKDDLALSESIGDLQSLRIYETQAAGKLHDLLKTLPYYVCSEFHDSTPPGSVKGGVRCEDLQRLTFEENVFDLVISQDVLEHVADPVRAFREIVRILKPGGYHIFTVPIHEKHNTVSRAILNETGIVQLMPAVYHGDPLRQGGSYVYTDFGEDIVAKLNSIGMNTKITYYSRWHAPEEVTFINKQDEIYRRYLDANHNDRLADFFKYNSAVLVSRKIELSFTGERFLPHVSGEIAYEHLHRYAFASDFVSGKTVLDIASGEGYGSGLLAKNAKKVIGVDLSEETITHAKSKYASQGNLEFRLGSCINIPCENGIFDVVVSFETIEHHAEHEKMLDEIKRVLKPDGLLVISSPNKKTYTDDSGVKNEFHVKELYLKEFNDLLSKGFKFINILGQRLTFSSLLWPLEKNSLKGATHYFGDAFNISSSHSPNFEALYFVAVCTNSESIENSGNQMSLFTEKSDLLFKNYNTVERQIQVKDGQIREKDGQIQEKERQIQEKERQIREKDGQVQAFLNSYSWKVTAPLRSVFKIVKG